MNILATLLLIISIAWLLYHIVRILICYLIIKFCLTSEQHKALGIQVKGMLEERKNDLDIE